MRSYILGGICGVPAGAFGIAAVSLNFTVVGPTGAGFLVSWPTGGAVPPVSTLNFSAGQTVANAAVVLTSTGGSITVNVSAPTHLLVDINGYYAPTSGAPKTFEWDSFGLAAIVGHQTGPSLGFGVLGQTDASATPAAGVFGISTGNASGTYGVYGLSGAGLNAAGVRGVDGTGSPPGPGDVSAGVRGESASSFGVLGLSKSVAVVGEVVSGIGSLRAYGILGRNNLLNPHGAEGVLLVTGNDSAGVFGVDGTGIAGGGLKLSAGVRGESKTNFGVLGLSQFEGVSGELLNSGGGFIAGGILGSAFGATPPPGAPWGVWSSGNFGATGVKNFVEPHPSDPSKVILYSSLEGREVGTYFRGSARTVKGEAVVEVPEDFRIVTDEEGLTVQLTAVGSPPTMYVASRDLYRIVVHSARDLEFDYLVQGVRRAFKDHRPVTEGSEFMPRSADETMPLYLTEEAKRRLVANGTYNSDGTVNMLTAERVGWTRIWKEKEERDKAAEAAAASAMVPPTAKRK